MHVADVAVFFAPHSGGVKRYLLAKHEFLSAQADLRHSLLVPGARDSTSTSGLSELKSLKIPCGGGYRIPFRLSRWRDRLCELSPDVIEAGDPYQLAWAALGAARKLGVPAVAFVHSDLSRVLGSRLGRHAGAISDRYLLHLYSRFDLVTAPSQVIADQLQALGLTNVAIQPLGVDSETFHPDRRSPNLRAQLRLPDSTRLLIFAGRLAREKQIPQLIDAFATLGRPYHLLLVGGPIRRSISANVTLLPYEQSATRLATLIASADALVHAGLHETFGLVVLEAMACGRPVIAVRSGALPEHIDDSVGVLSAPNSVASLCAAIEELYARDWNGMGMRARQRVERTYSWRRIFTRQIERYRALVNSHAAEASLRVGIAEIP